MPYLWGRAFPEFTCDYLCCVLLYMASSQKGQILLKPPAVFHPSQGHKCGGLFQTDLPVSRVQVKPDTPISLKGCLGNVAQGTHAVVNAQALERDRKPNPYNG